MTLLSGLDAAGRRRSPATMPGYHAGRLPRNKGMRYPADPPTVEDFVAVKRSSLDGCDGRFRSPPLEAIQCLAGGLCNSHRALR